jgi:CBS domain containing-hemolysin-like protein
MITAVILAVLGLFLSAFFSGSETGFYRVTRVRLVLDAMAGDRISRVLLWLTNRPSVFVATTLIGNNLSNYITSLAIVLGVRYWIVGPAQVTAQMVAPLVLAPLLFIYGELLPKHLFFHAPNRLLHRAGWLLLIFSILFLPLSLALWGLSKLLEGISGQSPQRAQLTLARRELRSAIDEGGDEGVLRPSQRRVAQGLFTVANQPVSEFAVPIQRLAAAHEGMTRNEILSLAQRQRVATILVEDSDRKRRLQGYIRVVDLWLDNADPLSCVKPLMRINASEAHINALSKMHARGEDLAEVIDDQQRTLGILTIKNLSEPLFRGAR